MRSTPRTMAPVSAHLNRVYIYCQCDHLLSSSALLTHNVAPYPKTLSAAAPHVQGFIQHRCWSHRSCHCFRKLPMCVRKKSSSLIALGVPYDLSTLRSTVQATTCRPSSRHPCASFSTYLPHWTFTLCGRSTRFYHIYWFRDILHPRIPPLAFSSSRQISWTSNCQNIKVVGGIYRHNRRFAQVL